MANQNSEKVLKRQLEILNLIIDEKILRGYSYKRESKQHKFVLQKLNNLKRSKSGVWMFRTLSIA